MAAVASVVSMDDFSDEEESYQKTDLRISTMVITAHWGTPINLDLLFQLVRPTLIPIWLPMEGILKFEHKKQVMGYSHKDIFTNRKATSKSFFNQSTMIVRKCVPSQMALGQPSAMALGQPEMAFKQVNIKLFGNGGIQMTGVMSEEFARTTIEWLLHQIKLLPESPFAKEPIIERLSTQLINTDYKIDKFINQEALHQILITEYNLFSMLEKTIYQGINTKFFYNTNNETGVCCCTNFCKGQGTGEGDGQCKRITISIFRTGRIIVTGARRLEQIHVAYDFLNQIFDVHHDEIFYEPNTD
jgi:TATA-box binding protein (TBP) (component of TFIID and TFIIIB)